MRPTRRALQKGVAMGGASTIVGPGVSRAEARAVAPEPSERGAMNEVAEAVVREFEVPGLSVAISAGGKLVYEEGFGFADRGTGEKVTPRHLFRIASLSKPITSVAIFTLIERGKLSLTDRVFGPGAVLGTDFGAPPYQRHVGDITIDHLLTHTAGGWSNDDADPMFGHDGKNHRQLITTVVADQALEKVPGEHYAYSNFGYCLLGRVIEKLTGASYRDFVRDQILARCGVRDMHIAGNTREQRAPGEVVYYREASGDRDPYSLDVARMDSHGGWIASAPDLVRFLVHVDGFAGVPDILRPETLRAMSKPSPVQADYASGWAVNANGNWWHFGGLAGTRTLMVRTSRGLCWAALTNRRWCDTGSYSAAIDRMMWNMVSKVKAWPT
ncbi:MAG: class A beta-lactamase-related serine hydrolase [Reyranella sp.]|nr:MAG: class A beta-lactamase-related serine hydrolase [Reyranella sp.]